MIRATTALLLSLALLITSAEAETRTWTDSSGQFKIEAEFESYAEGSVTLKKQDGETITVPMTKLSRADQTWVRAELREMRAGRGRPMRGGTNEETSPAANGMPGDWLEWRGPNRNNIAPGPAAPTSWSDSENVQWRVEVPGRGHSSPIIVGDLIVLTSADENRKTTGVFAFDRRNGKLIWQTPITQGGFQSEMHPKNTHATSTVASNGKQLFAVFIQNQAVQLVALDMKGRIQWQINAGSYNPQQYKFGYGPSPILYDDMVIVASEYEKGFIAAYAQQDGKPRWMQPRNGISFSSPVVAKVAGKDQMLISGLKSVSSYDPKTGKVLWTAPGTTDATCGTMVWDEDIVFASGGYPDSQTVAVKGDGSGRVLWTNNEKCYEQSMLAHNGYVYAMTDNGIFYCWNGKTGEEMWKKRLGGPVSSSPLLSGDNIFVTNEQGNVWVVKANPQSFEMVAENRLGDDIFATPIVSQGRLYARFADSSQGRRQEYLICIAEN